MGMSKKSNRQGKTSDSSDTSNQVYQVEKIVNQRVLNGKKQYKVIWVGYSFEEATWEPEENLNCPQKIQEFLRRYQDVIRRKMMGKQIPSNGVQSIQKPSINCSSQKNLMSSQARDTKLIPVQSPLNKQKLQQSLQKTSVVQKNVPPTEGRLKQTSLISKNTVQENNYQMKIPVQQNKIIQIKQSQPTSSFVYKKQPTTNNNMNGSSLKPSTLSSKIIEQPHQQSTQTPLQQQSSPNIFLPVNQRLNITQILGIVEFEQFDQPLFFLVRNKFQKEQRLVERERVMNEATEKLIEFYQSLIESN